MSRPDHGRRIRDMRVTQSDGSPVTIITRFATPSTSTMLGLVARSAWAQRWGTTMSCEQEQQTLDALTARLQDLQSQLDSAATPQKAGLVRRIDAMQKSVNAAAAALAVCQKDPGKKIDYRVKWPATLTVWVQSPARRKVTSDIMVDLAFTADRTQFFLGPFSGSQNVDGIGVTVNVGAPDPGNVGPPGSGDPPDVSVKAARRQMTITVSVDIVLSDLPVIGSIERGFAVMLDTSATINLPGESDTPNGNGALRAIKDLALGGRITETISVPVLGSAVVDVVVKVEGQVPVPPDLPLTFS